jgi:translocator assembly and maintenance protein 41
MDTAAAGRALELAGPLRDLVPPVDFCCAYGSSLLHARTDETSMVDYILGVADPLQWHSEVVAQTGKPSSFLLASLLCFKLYCSSLIWMSAQNLERNPEHYSSWMARRGPGAVRFPFPPNHLHYLVGYLVNWLANCAAIRLFLVVICWKLRSLGSQIALALGCTSIRLFSGVTR